MEEAQPIPTFRFDPAVEKRQIDRLRQMRASRNVLVVEEKLERLEEAASGAENLMPLILDAADTGATVGEISDRLRNAFGEYQETRA
jgi:methylmalonyl-CoA mutase N-terminal domain/subunit